VVGGMQSVSVQMADELGTDTVLLNQPVRRIDWSDEGVTVSTDELTVRAAEAIIAVPPNLYSRITYDPPLPRLQQIFHQHQSMGLVIKVHATYSTPFWREQGLSGTGFGAGRLVQEVYDNTNHGEEQGTLVGFISDVRADAMWALDEDSRRQRILQSLAEFLGPQALEPEVFYLSDFGAEEWTRGAYATSYDLGGLHRWGRYQNEPVGPLRFASSDIAAEGYQPVDGAVRIGTATAERTLNAGVPCPDRRARPSATDLKRPSAEQQAFGADDHRTEFEGTLGRQVRGHRRSRHRHLLHRPGLYADLRTGADDLRSRSPHPVGAAHRLHADAPRRLRIPGAQHRDAGFQDHLHLGDPGTRALAGMDRGLWPGLRHRPRPREPRGRGRGLPLPPPVPSVQRSADRRTHPRPVDQHPRPRGAHRSGRMDLLQRRRGHREAPGVAGRVPGPRPG